MFKLKYKMHRLVNILYYALIFLLGFLVGGGYDYEFFKENFISIFIN